jgi:hypothetical protein
MDLTVPTTTFTIRLFDYKKGIPVYKASIVDLTLVALTSLENIDIMTRFGAEFYQLSGNQIKQFLELICTMYESYSISDPRSVDYRTSYNFWFLEVPLRRRVKYAELHLENAMHKLNLLLNVLIIQLRTKLDYLKKVHLSSMFSDILIVELEKLLSFLPEPQQKEIVITDKRETDETDGTLPIKTIMITYEPFIEHVNASFNEASKLKRISDREEKKVNKKIFVRQIDNDSDERHNVVNEKKEKNKKKKNIPDEDGWILK